LASNYLFIWLQQSGDETAVAAKEAETTIANPVGASRPLKTDQEKVRATIQRSVYFTPAEVAFIDNERGMVKFAPFLRRALHDAGFFDNMRSSPE